MRHRNLVAPEPQHQPTRPNHCPLARPDGARLLTDLRACLRHIGYGQRTGIHRGWKGGVRTGLVDLAPWCKRSTHGRLRSRTPPPEASGPTFTVSLLGRGGSSRRSPTALARRDHLYAEPGPLAGDRGWAHALHLAPALRGAAPRTSGGVVAGRRSAASPTDWLGSAHSLRSNLCPRPQPFASTDL